MRLLLAHLVDWLHCYVFRHWPYWTCRWVAELWPDDEHGECWFCDRFFRSGDDE